jgi:prolyl oligopeptidase
MSSLIRFAFACTLAFAGSAAFAAEAAPPSAAVDTGRRVEPAGANIAFPATPVREVIDTYFGVETRDPYRWLEDVQATETTRWMKAAGAHAEATLASIPGRDAMRSRIAELESGETAKIGRVLRLAGDLYVYESRGARDNQFAIVMRRGLDGKETVLVDPVALSRARGDAPVAVNFFSVSPDGKTLAYGVSERGSEAAILHLLDVRTRMGIGEPITRADFGVARWSVDSKHFAFNRLR